jgi:membrane-associated phospholipid phosphatase
MRNICAVRTPIPFTFVRCSITADACSVSVATIYGGYHYAADVAAGFGLSRVAAVAAFALRDRRTSGRPQARL